MSPSLLLVGLGNPGANYARHRHNVGFMAVDAIAEAHRFSPWRAKYQGAFSDGALGVARAAALKPATFMNDSGRSVATAMRFLNLGPDAVIVFHDELDLEAGKVKAKTGGGTAGHNGLRSIGSHVGSEFRRVRIGIGHPGERTRVTGHVLGDFAKSDKDWLDPLLAAIAACAPTLADGDQAFSSAVALRRSPPKPKADNSKAADRGEAP